MKTRQELAREAIQVQDACNPSGVAHFLVECFQHESIQKLDTESRCKDPIIQMVVSKLTALCHMDGDYTEFSVAYKLCRRIAEIGE